MARALKAWPAALAIGVMMLIAALMWIGWQQYDRDYVVATEDDGSAVTKIIAARFASTGSLKVSELSGTVQSTASDIRGFGWLKSDQVVKMPFSVDYFIETSTIGQNDLEWVPQSRTLIVNAPEITVARPNVDEARRTLVKTTGLFVTREAGEELSRRTSAYAQAKALSEARSPERIAQARENGRKALAALLGTPLKKMGYKEVRVLVTFPSERPAQNREQWDVTTPIDQVLANHQQ